MVCKRNDKCYEAHLSRKGVKCYLGVFPTEGEAQIVEDAAKSLVLESHYDQIPKWMDRLEDWAMKEFDWKGDPINK